MRKIETQLLAAIKAGKPFSGGNTKYYPISGTVTLHGNLIAKREGDVWKYTLAGWNTATTRSRVNAMMRELRGHSGVCTRLGQALYAGAPISNTEWF